MWNPEDPTYGEIRQKISEVVNSNDPMKAEHIVAAGAELGIKAGASPTQLRSVFENSLQHAQQEQPSGFLNVASEKPV